MTPVSSLSNSFSFPFLVSSLVLCSNPISYHEKIVNKQKSKQKRITMSMSVSTEKIVGDTKDDQKES